jgi:hypothetical protein
MERLRTSLFGVLAQLLARLTDGYITLPLAHGRGGRDKLSAEELLADRFLFHRAPARMIAPTDFTARVMARVATESAVAEAAPARLAAYAAPVEDSSLLHRAGVVVGTLGFSALIVLGSSFAVSLADPSLALSLLSALVNIAVTALSTVRLALEAFVGVASNAGLTTALMTLLLGGILLGWAKISRLYARPVQEA